MKLTGFTSVVFLAHRATLVLAPTPPKNNNNGPDGFNQANILEGLFEEAADAVGQLTSHYCEYCIDRCEHPDELQTDPFDDTSVQMWIKTQLGRKLVEFWIPIVSVINPLSESLPTHLPRAVLVNQVVPSCLKRNT